MEKVKINIILYVNIILIEFNLIKNRNKDFR